MIGSIIDVEESILQIELSFDVKKSKNLINTFVLIRDEKLEFVGEIIRIKNNIVTIRLIGEYLNGNVVYGTIRHPSFRAQVYIISDTFIPNIIGKSTESKKLKLGQSVLYGVDVNVGIDSMFGSHFSVFGSTGSGKSCGVARIIQNIFNNGAPKNARFMIFDAYGEYKTAFSKFESGTFKAYTTDVKSQDELLKIPLWLLSQDDIALLLNATKSSQILVIDKALRFVNVFAGEGEEAKKYKNSIIANALLEILISGRTPVRIRDQVLAILSKYNTQELNSDTPIVQPGYTRTLKQCMYIDNNGKMSAIELVEAKLQEFIIDNMNLTLPDGSYKYTLDDLLDALDFALIDEGVWKSEETYDAVNFLKIRLQNLIKSDSSKYFDLDYISNDQFIEGLFKNEDGTRAQIVNFNINYIDDRFAKTVTKIYSKLIFDFAKKLEDKASMPFNIILEEAHRYVQNDSDVDVIGYNIFERICKEGRKYGVLLGFISQRPLELSETCISQCSNYFIFKMTHKKDLEFIESSVPYITDDMINKIKSLMPGSALAFGKSFSVPTTIDFVMPDPAPRSESAHVSNIWYN